MARQEYEGRRSACEDLCSLLGVMIRGVVWLFLVFMLMAIFIGVTGA